MKKFLIILYKGPKTMRGWRTGPDRTRRICCLRADRKQQGRIIPSLLLAECAGSQSTWGNWLRLRAISSSVGM